MIPASSSATVRSLKTAAKWLVLLALAVVLPLSGKPRTGRKSAPGASSAVILLYHRFGPKALGETTVTTSVFAAQLEFLHDHGYTVVPLRDIVNFVLGRGALPPRAVAIVADDGHISVFTDMRPLVERFHIPVTLFIYPSAISNAPYAMTWKQLKALQATGLFDVQSHTYWHPNFHVEKRRLSPAAYQKLVDSQLDKSRTVLEQRLGTKVDMLAWPFGIYDDQLIAAARHAGYIAAFTMARRPVARTDNSMEIPRFMVTNDDVGRRFQALLTQREKPAR